MDPSPSCPFCKIASSYPSIPFNDPDINPTSLDPDARPLSHLILSTDHVLAFLDIMPLTRGHVLVAPRKHYNTVGDMGVQAGQEVCSCVSPIHLHIHIQCNIHLLSILIFSADRQMAPNSVEGCHENRLRGRSRQTLECGPEQRYVLPLLFTICPL